MCAPAEGDATGAPASLLLAPAAATLVAEEAPPRLGADWSPAPTVVAGGEKAAPFPGRPAGSPPDGGFPGPLPDPSPSDMTTKNRGLESPRRCSSAALFFTRAFFFLVVYPRIGKALPEKGERLSVEGRA